jgi:eukaryotic translation initiation factor 2C
MGFAKNAETEKFLMEGRDGKPDKEVTVAQYFKMELNMTVTKPGLPCVRYGKRSLVPYVSLLFLIPKLM